MLFDNLTLNHLYVCTLMYMHTYVLRCSGVSVGCECEVWGVSVRCEVWGVSVRCEV